jgi:hypothetical protein
MNAGVFYDGDNFIDMGICNQSHYGWILSLGIKGDAFSSSCLAR